MSEDGKRSDLASFNTDLFSLAVEVSLDTSKDTTVDSKPNLACPNSTDTHQ